MNSSIERRAAQAVLPDFVSEHWQDILLLDYRFDFQRDEVRSTSVRNSE
jgi:hypothetical protein